MCPEAHIPAKSTFLIAGDKLWTTWSIGNKSPDFFCELDFPSFGNTINGPSGKKTISFLNSERCNRAEDKSFDKFFDKEKEVEHVFDLK